MDVLGGLHNKLSCNWVETGLKLNCSRELLEATEVSIHSNNEFHKHKLLKIVFNVCLALAKSKSNLTLACLS